MVEPATSRKREAYRVYQHAFAGYQRNIEAAIATILFTEEEYRAVRMGRA